jgi:hypothetical protein
MDRWLEFTQSVFKQKQLMCHYSDYQKYVALDHVWVQYGQKKTPLERTQVNGPVNRTLFW